jgi:hypothetical protein
MLIYLKKAGTLSAFQMKISAFHRRDTEVMAYIVTYIIPFWLSLCTARATQVKSPKRELEAHSLAFVRLPTPCKCWPYLFASVILDLSLSLSMR